MKKEEWINKIMESAADIKPAEASPFLLQKIKNRLHHGTQVRTLPTSVKAKWAVAASLLLAINIAAVLTYQKNANRNKEEVALKSLSNQMNTGTDYNY